MKFLKELTYDNYAFWLGDGINEKLNISTRLELAEKIYSQLGEDTKAKYNLDTNKLNLTEVAQVFLDSATGSSHNLLTLLTNDLKYFGKAKPYSYLAKIPNIDTVITHDHSKILEHIWETGESHNIFKEKEINAEVVNLFKILGDYSHIEQLVLTSQNLRKVKVLKLYNHFWEKLATQVNEKNLVLMGLNLDNDTREILEFVLSKFKNNEMTKYYVTNKSLSQDETIWLTLQGFELIHEEDEDFIKELYLHHTGLTFEDDPTPTDTIVDFKDLINEENIKDFTGLLDIDELIAQNEEKKLNDKETESKVETETEIIEIELKEEFEEPAEFNNDNNNLEENLDIDTNTDIEVDMEDLSDELMNTEELEALDGVENLEEVELENNNTEEAMDEIVVEEAIFDPSEIELMDNDLEEKEIIIEETIINVNELTLDDSTPTESIEEISKKAQEEVIEKVIEEPAEEAPTKDDDQRLIDEAMAVLNNAPNYDLKEKFGVEVDKIEDSKEEIIETSDRVEIIEEVVEEAPKEYVVENLEIPLFVSVNTIHAEIFESETKNRGKRLVEFREERYPSYKIDDFSDRDYYKALSITVPFQSKPLPNVNLGQKEFAGKVDIKCGDQTIYGVGLKSHVLDKQNVVEFKNHDFHLTLLLKNGTVTNFSYKISENTVNIKGKNLYLFFKNLFSGLELTFENKKKATGAFKIISNTDLDQVSIIVNTLDLYFDIKKHIKNKNVKLRELLNNTNSLKVLHSFYTSRPKVVRGNLTLRSIFSDDSILDCRTLHTSYPVRMNFLGKIISFIEFSTISITPDNIKKVNENVEIQAFDIEQKITYKEIPNHN